MLTILTSLGSHFARHRFLRHFCFFGYFSDPSLLSGAIPHWHEPRDRSHCISWWEWGIGIAWWLASIPSMEIFLQETASQEMTLLLRCYVQWFSELEEWNSGNVRTNLLMHSFDNARQKSFCGIRRWLRGIVSDDHRYPTESSNLLTGCRSFVLQAIGNK
jgi:hypothetical protein